MNLIKRLRPGSRPVWTMICATALAVGIASVASGAAGDAVRIAKRNFGTGTTAIVDRTTGYATRQSNNLDGDGGAASYGCRADAKHEACLYSLNHSGGTAFHFQIDKGVSGGFFDVRPPTGKTANDVAPFTTNAHGVATGLNADQVDGKSASDLTAAAQAAVDAAKPLFAKVNADGTVTANRGLAQSAAVQHTASTGLYTVTFAGDVSKCATTVTETTNTTAGFATVAPVAGHTDQVQVETRDNSGAATDEPFDLVVNC